MDLHTHTRVVWIFFEIQTYLLFMLNHLWKFQPADLKNIFVSGSSSSSSSSSSRELCEARGVVVFCLGNSLVGLLRGSLADWLAIAMLCNLRSWLFACFVWLLLASLVCFHLLALLVCQLQFTYVAWFAWLARRARVLTWFGLDSLCSVDLLAGCLNSICLPCL